MKRGWSEHPLRYPTLAVPIVTTRVEREQQMAQTALAQCQGRVSGANGAAEKPGIPRQTRDARIASLGIDKHRFKTRWSCPKARCTISPHLPFPFLEACRGLHGRAPEAVTTSCIADPTIWISRRKLGNFRKYGNMFSINRNLFQDFWTARTLQLPINRDLKDSDNPWWAQHDYQADWPNSSRAPCWVERTNRDQRAEHRTGTGRSNARGRRRGAFPERLRLRGHSAPTLLSLHTRVDRQGTGKRHQRVNHPPRTPPGKLSAACISTFG